MDQQIKITVNHNGSLKVEGEVLILDGDGRPYDLQGRTTIGLCRCGLSANKPFCDGAHRQGFEHSSEAFALPPKKV
ncbi:MAG: CDGSH iron-sulfur domain-containing protein [Saprospiraceae bacterium]|jgi:CDGSH-type Zn-finger protein|nr:CDGSH iron-sulfur domain-containing protein [Saprospiraceae bacterium]